MKNHAIMTNIIVAFCLINFCVLDAQRYLVGYNLTYKPSSTSDDTISKNYFLEIQNNKSIFRSEIRRQSDSLTQVTGYGLGFPNSFNEQICIISDLITQENLKYVVSPTSRDRFYIPITEELNWKILTNTTKIANYNCQKAEVSYGNRKWTAWFTTEVPILQGPYIFHGLPGLIIQISDSENNFNFILKSIKKYNNTELYPPSNGTVISWDNFEKIQQDYYDDPFSFVKANNIKTVKDDGHGGYAKTNFRELTLMTRKGILENDNTIELDKMIFYKKK